MNIINKLINRLFPSRAGSTRRVQPDRLDRYRAMLRQEALIGGSLIGPLAEGAYREFFCLDEHTWIWHEEWTDASGHHVVTTRYDVRPDGIVKSQGNRAAEPLTPEEARNFYYTVMAYCDRVLPARQAVAAA